MSIYFLLVSISLLGLSESSELFFQCGKRVEDTTSTIRGGYDAKDKDWPWHTAIFHYDDDSSSKKEYKCGGVLISNLWVLTAAHCVTDEETFDALPASNIFTQFGQYRLKGYSAHSQSRNVTHVYVHESYEEQPHLNDIALLFLSNPLNLATDFVKPVCVSTFNVDSLIGDSGTIVGWGYTDVDAQVSDNLKAANLPIVEHIKCIESNRQTYGRLLSGGMFCAGHLNGTAACNGDSGGGLFIKNGDSWYVAGIVSFTVVKKTYNDQKVCSPDDYAVFTDVNHFKDWIDSTQLVMHPSISERNARANVIRWLEHWRKSMRCGWSSVGIPAMDPLQYEKADITGTGTNNIKLWLYFEDIRIKNMRHFEIEEIKIAYLTEKSVDIHFNFHLDKLILEGNTVKGQLMNFIDFSKHGSYSAKLFDVTIKGKAYYIFKENGKMQIESLKTYITADDITTKIDDIFDNTFVNMMFNGALSSILPNILQENQEILSDAIEEFALPKINLIETMTLKSLIQPPPKRNPFYENPC